MFNLYLVEIKTYLHPNSWKKKQSQEKRNLFPNNREKRNLFPKNYEIINIIEYIHIKVSPEVDSVYIIKIYF